MLRQSVSSTEVYISRRKRGLTRSVKQGLKDRSVIESIIGPMKADRRSDRSTRLVKWVGDV